MENLHEAIKIKMNQWTYDEIAEAYIDMGDVNLGICEEGVLTKAKEVDTYEYFISSDEE